MSRDGNLMFVPPLLLFTAEANRKQVLVNKTAPKASKRSGEQENAMSEYDISFRHVLHANHFLGRLPKHPLKMLRPKKKSSPRSEHYFDKSPLQSLSCRNSPNRAHSMFLSMPMLILKSRLSGVTAMQRKLWVERRSNLGASVLVIIVSIHWSAIGLVIRFGYTLLFLRGLKG